MLDAAPALHVVLMTCPPDAAEALLVQLLEERLVGCGNILPAVRSCYWWEGEVCRDEEALVVMETAPDRLEALLERAAQLHPYDVPKLLALDPSAVNEPYVAWLRAVTRPA
jgi:periplasmic divalent cation tolerance protein